MFEFGRDLRKLFAQARETEDLGWVELIGADLLRAEARREARTRFLAPLHEHLGVAGIGHVSEIADAEPPHTPRGCPFQAWSLCELLRAQALVEADPAEAGGAAAS